MNRIRTVVCALMSLMLVGAMSGPVLAQSERSG